jgi:hypothetical protein
MQADLQDGEVANLWLLALEMAQIASNRLNQIPPLPNPLLLRVVWLLDLVSRSLRTESPVYRWILR